MGEILGTSEAEQYGVIRHSLVQFGEKYYHVSTVNLGTRGMLNPMAEWRNDWWPPKYPNETMVFLANEEGKHTSGPIHCQGHRKREPAKKAHIKLAEKLAKEGPKVLNGRQMQTSKEVSEPKGLINKIKRDVRLIGWG